LVVILPSEHRLATHQAIDPRDLVGETYVGMSDYGHVPRTVIDRYLRKQGIALTPSYFSDNFAQSLSLVASTGGVAILPTYVGNFLSASLTSRPFKGKPPTIDLAVG
jgi:LysR family hca operon transcriptional activator